ncbi:uncharacterized protein C8orf48-like [Pristis pectinata]|uniref:uncharacterized protein C8orf48-like n=1 Tax=Pristis pectinata TaxID=685728 RepID=UPI00223E8354|nr:uncharacterized protein C8orf48-like [Pristis pectinata]XP_051877080.1 uncharacterized protein C8orf48-like [Pristis pectinata]
MSEGQILVQNPEDDSCEAGSSCMNSTMKYSDESFATYTGENEESHQSYSQSFESYQSLDEDFERETVSEISAIKSELEFMSPQNFKEETKEECACCEDSEGLLARERLIEKLLGVLNSNRFVSTPYHQKEKYTMSHREAIQPVQVESAPVQKYCSMKIDQIQRQIQQEQLEPSKYGRQQLNKPLGGETAPQQNCIVPQHLINRVRLKYITETVKQVVQTNVHQPSRCAACLKKISKLAEHNFLRIKKIQLEEASMQEKIEEHIYTKDALTLIGEIHNSLPKHSDVASLVWKRLFDKINLRK